MSRAGCNWYQEKAREKQYSVRVEYSRGGAGVEGWLRGKRRSTVRSIPERPCSPSGGAYCTSVRKHSFVHLFFAIFTFSHYCTQHNALTQVYECFEYFVPCAYVGKGAQLHVLRISFGVCHDILTSWWVTIDCWGREGLARCDN